MIRFASTDCRRETGNIKWELQGPLPFGIADMDIESPPCVVDALQARLNHRFYGYAFMTDELRAAIPGERVYARLPLRHSHVILRT